MSVLAPEANGSKSKLLVATMMKNIESLGYIFSKDLYDHLVCVQDTELLNFFVDILPVLKEMKGAHVQYNPMYPNFPKQVMKMDEFDLYFNAILHYWTGGDYIPETKEKKRKKLKEDVVYDIIKLGNLDEFKSIFTNIVGSKTSISQSDKDIISEFVQEYGLDLREFMPREISFKENLCFLYGELFKVVDLYKLQDFYKLSNITEVLRIYTGFSGGDVSLVTNTKFIKLSRPMRKLFLSFIENAINTNSKEDILRHKNKWLRVGERLHVGDYAKLYPKSYELFNSIRSGEKISTFNSRVEKSLLKGKKLKSLIEELKTRPTEFGRRLDSILRTFEKYDSICSEFDLIADKIPVSTLLQIQSHFKNRDSQTRVFFPKGSVAKAKIIENELPKIKNDIKQRVINIVESALERKFAKLPKLGKVYVDGDYSKYIIPFSERSASKSLKSIVRGTRIPFGENKSTIRFFIWWKNSGGRTDIDLSALGINHDMTNTMTIAYYNLKEGMGCHSGDIVNAPNGACEFIDINIEKAIDSGMRYIMMNINSFTGQNFDTIQCHAGWMMRDQSQRSGIFDAKTVKNKFDVNTQAKTSVPMILDLVNREVIWLDITLNTHKLLARNVYGSMNALKALMEVFINFDKPNIQHLIDLNVKTRGELVNSPEDADLIINDDFVCDTNKVSSILLG